MNHKHLTALLLALVATAGTAQTRPADAAAEASPTRAQVRMETKEFLRTHRWDEPLETWILKSGVEPPTGVASRATVKAQRDEYMRRNRWVESTDTWVPRTPVPPTISSLTREQVRAETIAFTRTHHWDEETEAWVANRASKPK